MRGQNVTWLEAWDEAARVYFGEPCANVRRLLNVVRDLPFCAPESRWSPAREAWLVYQDEGETEIGRAAVALAYAIQATARELLAAVADALRARGHAAEIDYPHLLSGGVTLAWVTPANNVKVLTALVFNGHTHYVPDGCDTSTVTPGSRYATVERIVAARDFPPSKVAAVVDAARDVWSRAEVIGTTCKVPEQHVDALGAALADLE